jgi:hypothetical protein
VGEYYAGYAYLWDLPDQAAVELAQNNPFAKSAQCVTYTPPNEQYKRNTRTNGHCAVLGSHPGIQAKHRPGSFYKNWENRVLGRE